MQFVKVLVVFAVLCISITTAAAQAANDCQHECPDGTLVAKYNWDDEDGWVLDCGEDVIDFSNCQLDDDGQPISCDWTSTEYISTIVVKTGVGTTSYEDGVCPAETEEGYEGSFATCDGAISHVNFCDGEENGDNGNGENGNGDEEIPEFPTMAIPIAISLLAAMFFLRRH